MTGDGWVGDGFSDLSQVHNLKTRRDTARRRATSNQAITIAVGSTRFNPLQRTALVVLGVELERARGVDVADHHAGREGAADVAVAAAWAVY
jgi:hypothetical protein